ncbi:phage holin [Risungbinella massiliensis]|uniref:phage holin n=1 Tax=Risungbinella massiliensis TaxID=1329796 RepID=UPI0005CC2A3C|nr:phage holin [Risungbinella massiliensis]
MRIKQRLRNYGLWIAVASLVLMVLRAFGIDLVEEQYDSIVDSILGILVLLGIINNPTSNNQGFWDDPDNP